MDGVGSATEARRPELRVAVGACHLDRLDDGLRHGGGFRLRQPDGGGKRQDLGHLRLGTTVLGSDDRGDFGKQHSGKAEGMRGSVLLQGRSSRGCIGQALDPERHVAVRMEDRRSGTSSIDGRFGGDHGDGWLVRRSPESAVAVGVDGGGGIERHGLDGRQHGAERQLRR